jgi:hypothetical protein
MPNWCNNNLSLSHKDPAMLNRAFKALKNGGFFNEFSPVPEDLKITAGYLGPDNDPRQIELVAKTKANIEKYGYGNWYDYCINTWGTKWDLDKEYPSMNSESNTVGVNFDTAWGPPIQFYGTLESLGFSVTAYYYEPGMAFAGVYSDGVDDFFEYGGMSSEEAKAYLPETLDIVFGISEEIAEYEEERTIK